MQAQGGSLPYAEALVNQLTGAMEQAEAEWTDARESVAKLQELRAVARARALELHNQLVGFRRALRAIVGSSHVDDQNLRTARAQGDTEPEEVLGPEIDVDETEVTAPAPGNGHSIAAQPQPTT